ncbi:MAG: class I SAM-dependent methyltransferase [Burkholderiales bacterium]
MTPAQRPTYNETQIQESQYEFPYHYIPLVRNGKFFHARYWAWSYRYLGGIHLLLTILSRVSFGSLIDIGCGDGRFLREVASSFPATRLLGVDVSERAIAFAQVFNPQIAYQRLDILEEEIPARFDVATLVEVIEHVPPPSLPSFMSAVARTLEDEGTLILTAPHVNVPVTKKHFQHFDSQKLRSLLEPSFEIQEFIPFDVRPACSRLMWLLDSLLGPKGNLVLLRNGRLLNGLYNLYLRKFLIAKSESECERIAVVARKRAVVSKQRS